MVKCSETHRLEGEALHRLIQAKKLVPLKKFQLFRFEIAAPPPLEISGYAPELPVPAREEFVAGQKQWVISCSGLVKLMKHSYKLLHHLTCINLHEHTRHKKTFFGWFSSLKTKSVFGHL